MTVAGGNGCGNALNQLSYPHGLDIDDDNQSIVIADQWNDRIVEWTMGASHGKVIAGGQGLGNRLDQLNNPTDVLIDKETNSLFIADQWNRRVLRWSRRQGTTQGEVIVDNIYCTGLAIDHQRYLYVSDIVKHEVQRYRIGDKNGILRVRVRVNFIGGAFRGLHLHTKKACSLQSRLLSQLTLIVRLKEILPYMHLYFSASAKILSLILSLLFPCFALLLQPCSSFLSSYLFSFL